MGNEDHIEIDADFEQFEWLKNYCPYFEMDAKNIEILETPTEFYNVLKSEFGKCQSRFVISSLYLGSGALENELVEVIEANMKSNANLKGKVLLDYSRGLRGEKNSKTLLQKLINSYSNRFNLFLYQTPNLRGIYKLFPERSKEIFGVMHMKIYIADDTLVISGANLSNDYFVNRQDRCIVLRNCKEICNFLEEIVDSVGDFSFVVKTNGQIEYMGKHGVCHPQQDNKYMFLQQLAKNMSKVIQRYQNNKRSDARKPISDIDTNKAFIYPVFQLGESPLRTDELIINSIFEKSKQPDSQIYLSVGYFNLTKEYMKSIIEKSKSKFQILVSSPEANGFFNSSGFSFNIPKFYSYYEQKFFEEIIHKEQEKRLKIHEFNRESWTFHAKGVWYYPKAKSLPNMTIIGSSNYGYRSAYRDLECQLVIQSNNEQFQKKLDKERVLLFDKTTIVTPELFSTQYRSLSLWLKVLSKAIRSYF